MWAPAGKRSKMWIAKLVHLSEGGGVDFPWFEQEKTIDNEN